MTEINELVDQREQKLFAALLQRGYKRKTRKRLKPGEPLELVAPIPGVGKPLTGAPHSVFLDNEGGVRMLREGAPMHYAVSLPERTIKLLLKEF